MPDHFTCLLKTSVRTRYGTMDWFKFGKGVHEGCISSPCLFNLYTEYIMQNASLDKAQVIIKIAKRNISNLRYTGDTMFMAENENELKSFLMKVKEESEKAGLKLGIQKTKVMASGPITSWKVDEETMETVTNFIFLASKITADSDCSHEIKRCLLLGRKVVINLDRVLKKQRHYFTHKGPSSQNYGFSSSHGWMWELDHKEDQTPMFDAFELWHWRRLLRVPWTARGSNHSILKETNSEYLWKD